jgi:seryl-tRNA synthetase
VIDLKLLRSSPEVLRESLTRRGSAIDLDHLIALDESHRRLLGEVESMRAEQNRANKLIASSSGPERDAAIEQMRSVASGLKDLEGKLERAKAGLDDLLPRVPNLVHPQSPNGSGEDSNRVVKQAGAVSEFDFPAADHLDLGEALDIIDVKRASKVSGSRFAILKGKGALLELALVRFAMDRLSAAGFLPVIPPVLVREEAMYGTGFLPADEFEIYKTASDDLYLAGTSEVPVASMHAQETIAAADLPLRYAAFSTCFRREAGTYGKDTRGIIRVHQFDKVEMFVFCKADESEQRHEEILLIEEELFALFEVPYRVVDICAGDLGSSAQRKFDLEAWLPGSKRWLEVTSCSNCTDYQARRLEIRTKSEKGAELVHTLNGTAVAVGRAIVAILENHQRLDGSVAIPKALQPYTGFDEIKP